MFWSFLAKTWGAALLVDVAYGFVMVPVIAFMVRLGAGIHAMTPIGVSLQVYFWGGWSAYCAAQATVHVVAPDVSQSWLYYGVAFLAVIGPLEYMAYREKASAKSLEEAHAIQAGTRFYRWLVMIAYVLFCIWPISVVWLYGWLLVWLI